MEVKKVERERKEVVGAESSKRAETKAVKEEADRREWEE